MKLNQDEYSKAFGEYLKSLLDEKGMMQKDLAKKAGITEATVSRYIRGERIPRISQTYRIAYAIGVDMNTLIYLGKGEKHD